MFLAVPCISQSCVCLNRLSFYIKIALFHCFSHELMMIYNELLAFLAYYFLLATSNSVASSTPILYPSFEKLVDHLTSHSTLPTCTASTCRSTSNQANFSHVHVTDEQLFKLASYDRPDRKSNTCSGPYLIASTGIYCGKRLKYRHEHMVDQFLGVYYAEVPRSLRKPVKKRFDYSLQNATKFSPYCMQSLLMTENLSYGSFVMQNHFNDNCLSLNIYRADLRYGEKRKAIMLFSHGGSNQIGTSDTGDPCLGKSRDRLFIFHLGGGSLFDGSILASEGDIIVVTMNFRLNYHGFLSSGDDRLKGKLDCFCFAETHWERMRNFERPITHSDVTSWNSVLSSSVEKEDTQLLIDLIH